MNTDRELLEWAAKAAGIEGKYFENDNPIHTGIYRAGHDYYWNPLISDSEALRLAVVRKILRCHMDLFHRFYEEEIANGLDEAAATRRAIVRAAAEIGKAMP